MPIYSFLILFGIVLFSYSFLTYWRIYKLIDKPLLKKYWLVLIILIAFFLLGYLLIFYFSLKKLAWNSESLIDYILFFGAIFVVISAKVIYLSINDAKIHRLKAEENLTQLKKSQQEINDQKESLEKTNKLMIDREIKMAELKETLKNANDK